MSQFWIYFQIGLKHVLDVHSYDHVLFLIALAIPFSFRNWKRIVLLVSLFTIGHTMALLLSVFGIIAIKVSVVELLIPITILITAFYIFFASFFIYTMLTNVVFATYFIFFPFIAGTGVTIQVKTLSRAPFSSTRFPSTRFSKRHFLIKQVIFFFKCLIQTKMFKR